MGGDEVTTSNNAASANAADLPPEVARSPPFVKEVYENAIAEDAGETQQQQQAPGSSPLADKQRRQAKLIALANRCNNHIQNGAGQQQHGEAKKAKNNPAANDGAESSPPKSAASSSFVREDHGIAEDASGAQQRQRQGYGAGAYPPGVMPMVYMTPPNCGPMNPAKCSPLVPSFIVSTPDWTPDASTLGTALDLTYDSVSHRHEPICAKPCEGMGRMVGTTIDSFFQGCTSVLDYGDRLCSIMRTAERNNMKKKRGHGVDDGKGDLPMGMIAETPHPLPDGAGDLTEKMDELLKLLKDKESSAGSVRSREVIQAGEGKGGAREFAAVAAAAENEKEKDAFPTAGRNNNYAVDQANQLIGMFKTMNTSLNRFGILDESAISKASEMMGFRFDSLLLDPTVEEAEAKSKPASPKDPVAPTNYFDASLTPTKNQTNYFDASFTPTKSLMDESRDELSFDYNYKGVSVTGEARPQTEEKREKGATAAIGRPPLPLKAVARPPSLSMAAASPAKERDTTAFIGLVDGTKVMTPSTASAANKAPPKSQGRKPSRDPPPKKILKEPSFDAKRHGKGTKAASTRPSFPVRMAGRAPSLTTVAASPQKEPDEPRSSASSMDSPGSAAPSTPTSRSQGIKSPTGQRGRKILKDIKNRRPKNSVPRRGRGKTASCAVDVKVEDRRNDSSELRSVPVEQDPSSSAAAADFSTVDDMGFPLSNATAGSGGEGRVSWEGSFSVEVNPFVAGACVSVNETTDSGVRVCAWCRKGSDGDPEVTGRLKLCSRCQSTYYCSPECQSRDWINGHAKTCRPT